MLDFGTSPGWNLSSPVTSVFLTQSTFESCGDMSNLERHPYRPGNCKVGTAYKGGC